MQIRQFLIISALAAALLTGCGSSKSSSSSASSSSTSGGQPITVTSAPSGAQPQPKESLPAFEKRVSAAFAAAARGDCAPVKTFATSSNYSLKCTPGKAVPLDEGFK